jgi:hypothetical protein
MDAEIELQRVSNNAVKFEQGQKLAALEASTLAEQVTKLKSSLESTSSLCSNLDAQNQDLRAQVRPVVACIVSTGSMRRENSASVHHSLAQCFRTRSSCMTPRGDNQLRAPTGQGRPPLNKSCSCTVQAFVHPIRGSDQRRAADLASNAALSRTKEARKGREVSCPDRGWQLESTCKRAIPLTATRAGR